MRITSLDMLVWGVSLAGALLIGFGLVRLAGVEPALAVAGGGLVFLFCTELYTLSRARREVSSISAELKALRYKYDALVVTRPL